MSGEKLSEQLIEDLTGDLSSVRPLAHPAVRALPWFLLSVSYAFAVIAFLGLRPDLPYKLHSVEFLFETGLAFFTGASAALCALWMCVPDMRGRDWLPALPFTALGILLFWCVLKALTEGLNLPAPHWDHCFANGFLLGAFPAAFILFITRKGATTKPLMMAFMAVLAVGAFGYVGLRLTCMLDTIGHAGIYHVLPFVALGALFGLAARRVYRW